MNKVRFDEAAQTNPELIYGAQKNTTSLKIEGNNIKII